jgi:lysophospholipase L1-like esterase
VIFSSVLAASWIATWAAAPQAAPATAGFSDVTLRESVHVSIGGDALRIRLSNRYGDAPLLVGGASVAFHRIFFFGSPSVTIPPHADVYSDPVAIHVAPESDLVIRLYVPGPTGPATYHHLSYETTFWAGGDRVEQRGADGFTNSDRSWYFLDGVDVSGSGARGTVVAIGDSITNGQGSTVNGNNRWPDDLAQRLLASAPNRRLGVVSAAIDGNRILLERRAFGNDALARFDSDVLSQSGVAAVVVLLGINDIQQKPHEYDARRIEFGLEQIVLRAHAHGLRVVGCTITPYEGWLAYQPAGDATRAAVNAFIRSSGLFDGVADFDAVVRDPADPRRLSPRYDSGDHLHPNAAAYRLMANAIPLTALYKHEP